MIIESNFLKKYGRFEIFYMLVMVIYMAQATPETGRMIGGLSGNPIPFLLPIILTYMLWRKYPISFNNRNRLLRRSQLHRLFREAITLSERSLQKPALHRREEFVQQLRQLLLKSLTQLLEKLPEFVFLTVSK